MEHTGRRCVQAMHWSSKCSKASKTRRPLCTYVFRACTVPTRLSQTTSNSRTRASLKLRSGISTRQSYSTESSTSSPLGTIGEGESGIAAGSEHLLEKLEAPEELNEKEKEIWHKLNDALKCKELQVQDISGGCGSMYGIQIVSEKFRGLNMLKQQRLVNEVLGEEIKGWHGVQLKTRAP